MKITATVRQLYALTRALAILEEAGLAEPGITAQIRARKAKLEKGLAKEAVDGDLGKGQ